MNDISEFTSEEEWIKATEEAKNQGGIVAAEGLPEQDEIINWHELYEVVRLAYNDQLKQIEVLRNKLKATSITGNLWMWARENRKVPERLLRIQRATGEGNEMKIV